MKHIYVPLLLQSTLMITPLLKIFIAYVCV